MKIAQVSPLVESVPPKLYGGTERIVSYLSDELVRLGHEVTLFATGDSITQARLVPVWPRALRFDHEMRDHLVPQMIMLEMLAARSEEFDVIHTHIDYIGFPLLRRLGVPFVTTLHGRLDFTELRAIYREFSETAVVSISDSQRKPLPEANYVATVHHGLPERLLLPGFGGKYLAFLGRVSPEKQPDAAIRIAAAAGLPLKMAAKVDKVDQQYFNDRIVPLLDDPSVEFIGEIGEADKAEFLGNAAALVFPIGWEEPFGLVMIEAMACGTPVIAFRRGSVPEVIEHGVTGFIVDTEEEAAAAAGRLHSLDRARIRRTFEERFTSRRMAENYLRVYREIIAQSRPALRQAV